MPQVVVPGGGVPTCLISGRDAIRILCRQDGKAFAAARRASLRDSL
jgi:hypothetical protein